MFLIFPSGTGRKELSVLCRRTIVAISLLRYGCHLVIYIYPFYRLHCHICGPLTTRRRRLAPRCALQLPFYISNQLFFSLRLRYCEFSFLLFNCRLIRATRVLFSWSSLVPIAANRFLKSHHSFHIYYIRKNTPPNPPTHTPPGPAATYYNDTYAMPSRLVSTLHSHRIALHLASYTYHRHPHHSSQSSSAPSPSYKHT